VISFTNTESLNITPNGGGGLRSEWMAGLRQNGWPAWSRLREVIE
jgi:hypothetical protein